MTPAPETGGALRPGFPDPVFDAQATFRAVLDAFAYPGRVREIGVELDPPAPLDAASAALALTLFDADTRIWLDPAIMSGAVPDYLRFHCGVPFAAAADARFAMVAAPAAMPILADFDIGEDRYPDRAATLVIQLPSLIAGPETTWIGPGIDGAVTVRLAGLPPAFWRQWADNHALYPLGVDVVFASGGTLVGLPRGVAVEG